MLELIYAALLINALVEADYIEGGGFKVLPEQCHAQLKIINAIEDVSPPTREQTEKTALSLIQESGAEEEDLEGIAILLTAIDVDLEFADE